MKKLFITLCLLICYNISFATEFTDNGIRYYILSDQDKTISAIFAGENTAKVVIPSTVQYNGTSYTVTEVGKHFFDGALVKVSELTIPPTIKKFNADCTNWYGKKVHISDLVAWCNIDFKEWGCHPLCRTHYLYLNNELIVDLVIPEGITKLKRGAFSDCKGIKSVVLPNSLTEIESGAFNECYSLNKITFGNNLKTIGDGAFYGCNLKNIEFPNSLEYIGNQAFEYTQLKKIYIPKNVNHIEKWAFRYTKPQSIEVDSENKYYDSRDNCNAIIDKETNTLIKGCSNTNVPNSVETIGSYSFAFCLRNSIEIPQSVKYIELNAFENCEIKSITLPNLEYIAPYLGSVMDKVTMKFKDEDDLLNYLSRQDIGIFYQQDTRFAKRTIYVGDKRLTEVNLPDTTTNIQWYEFAGWTDLKNIVIPPKVQEIGDCAFENCDNLETITILAPLKKIATNCFSNCNALKGVYITNLSAWCNIVLYDDDGPLNYAHHLFLNGKEVTNLIIPNDVTEMQTMAFAGCYGLTSVTMNDELTYTGGGTFKNCINLKNIDFGKGLKIIGGQSFYNCQSLTSVSLPDNIKKIHDGAFAECINLQKIDFGDGVETIADGAVDGCENLKSVSFGISTKKIDLSFFMCDNVEEIICRATTPPEANDLLFWNSFINTETVLLYVPAQSIEAYRTTYPWSEFKNILPISTTGIENITQQTTTDPNINTFDFFGRCVNNSTQKLIIRNGKKFLLK